MSESKDDFSDEDGESDGENQTRIRRAIELVKSVLEIAVLIARLLGM